MGGPGAAPPPEKAPPFRRPFRRTGRRKRRGLPFLFKLRYITFRRGQGVRGDSNSGGRFPEGKETSGAERKVGEMKEKKGSSSGILIPAGFLLGLLLLSCAEIPLNKISPPPAAKLRVFVLPLTGSPPPGGWGISHADFSRIQFRASRMILEGTGIYQVSTREDYLGVVGQRSISSSEWTMLPL